MHCPARARVNIPEPHPSSSTVFKPFQITKLGGSLGIEVKLAPPVLEQPGPAERNGLRFYTEPNPNHNLKQQECAQDSQHGLKHFSLPLRHLHYVPAGSILVKNAFLLLPASLGSIEQRRLNTSANCFSLTGISFGKAKRQTLNAKNNSVFAFCNHARGHEVW